MSLYLRARFAVAAMLSGSMVVTGTVVAGSVIGGTVAGGTIIGAAPAAAAALGGRTTLARAGNKRGWRERAWNDDLGAGGSGCSAYVSKPSWQHDRHCPGRTVADVSAVAANIPIFNRTYGGWVTVEGTSISAPLVAGVYGLAGNGARTSHHRLYRRARSFFDITRGDNSFFEPAADACGGDYLCVARKGYDAPTGLGSPDGTRAF
jgi:hypothetical protein